MITYTHQEAFSIIWEHAKKGVKSMDERSCMYRGPHMAKCFVGALIPDERYDEDMDRKRCLADEVFRMAEVRVATEIQNIIELQKIHDRHEPEEWTAHLVIYASDYGLTVPA